VPPSSRVTSCSPIAIAVLLSASASVVRADALPAAAKPTKPTKPVVLVPVAATPPPAISPTPIVFKPLDPKTTIDPRRPLLPAPTPLAVGTKLDVEGDAKPIEILIGTKATVQELGRPLESDADGADPSLHLVLDTP
jgi:hypothetical protein